MSVSHDRKGVDAKSRRRRFLAYEHRSEPLLSTREFTTRVVRHGLFALAIVVVWLAAGVAGYHWIARLEWVDATLNAAMILGGMGPVDTLRSDGAKLFAAAYALTSGVLFLGASGLLLAPVLHRILHKFHLDETGD